MRHPHSMADIFESIPGYYLEYVYPPIPVRDQDWQAISEHHEHECGAPMSIGHGRTREEAALSAFDSGWMEEG